MSLFQKLRVRLSKAGLGVFPLGLLARSPLLACHTEAEECGPYLGLWCHYCAAGHAEVCEEEAVRVAWSGGGLRHLLHGHTLGFIPALFVHALHQHLALHSKSLSKLQEQWNRQSSSLVSMEDEDEDEDEDEGE